MRYTLPCLCLALLSACGPQEPIRIGFIGGVSGRFADLGTAGRNGATLAVEWRNQAGGIHGRRIELLIRDDRQDEATVRDAVSSLVAEGASIIIGPMTSSMATIAVPEAARLGRVVIGGTITTTLLSGKDDNFFRVISSTAVYGQSMANFQRKHLHLERAAVAVDLANKDYTLSWLKDYREGFERLNGKVLQVVEYDSRQHPDYSDLAQRLLKNRPDVVSLVCNTVDAGMLVQKLRQLDKKVQIAGSGWTATERLLELAGPMADGMLVEQYFDRHDSSEKYGKFRSAYLQRFGQEPGYASVAGFDAATVALEALSISQDHTKIREIILQRREFPALQDRLVFDAYGDAARPQHMTVIQQGRFEALN